MAVAATHITRYEGAERRALADVLRAAARHAPIALVLALVAGIHVPTLHYYFFGDDFLVLGDIQASESFAAYVKSVVTLNDMTPNWRPLTMVAYWVEFKLFGFDATAWRIVNLGFHLGTVLLLYAFVLSMTKRVFVATASALVFGVGASAVHTVTYITAFPHVFSQFLLMGSLLSLHMYVQGRERRIALYWGALALYIAGFLANEGGMVLGAVIFAYYALTSLSRRRDVMDFAVKMTPFALAGGLVAGGLAGCGCQGVDEGFYGVGWHIPMVTFVYLSRLAYPVGSIPLEPAALEWVVGSVVAAFALFFLVRGPNIARIAALGMVLALMPYAPGKIWSATRYTYMALPFFAILAAVAAGFVHHHIGRLYKPAAHALAAVALVVAGGLYGWQTLEQTQPFLEQTHRWELLAAELRANYDAVPAGTTVYIVDDEGMWTNPFWQPTWMTSVGRALYGEDVTVRAVSTRSLERMSGSLGEDARLLYLSGDRLYPVTPDMVRHARE
jgi:hypothetical protein